MSCCCNKIVLKFKDDTKINVDVKDDKYVAKLDDRLRIIPPTSHRDLDDLDYENSGHTGFASSEQLSLLDNSAVKKDMSNTPQLSLLENRDNVYLYANVEGEINKVSAKTLLSRLLRTVDREIPKDWQEGEYIFKKVK